MVLFKPETGSISKGGKPDADEVRFAVIKVNVPVHFIGGVKWYTS